MRFELRVRKNILSIWGYLFLLFPHIFPVGIQHLYNLNSVVFRLTILSSIIIITIYAVNIVKGTKKINALVGSSALFSLYLILITAIKGQAVYRSITYVMAFWAEILWADLFVHRFGIRGISSLTKLTALYAIINTVFLVVSPEFFGAELSYRRYCFISNDNSLLPFLLPSMIICLVYLELVGKRESMMRFFLVFLIYGLSIYIVWTGTGVILFTLFIIFALLRRTGIWKFLSVKKVALISGVSVFLFVRFRIQDYFVQLFSVVQKDMTFSGRTTIWALGLELIKESWLFGSGMSESDLLFSIGSTRDFTVHNQFLQFIIWGGVILLLLYFFMIFSAYKGMYKRGNTVSEKIKMYSNLGLFAMLYYYVFEVHNSAPMFLIMLVLVYYLNMLNCDSVYEKY